MVAKFSIIPGDDFIWNRFRLNKFLIENQNKDIILDTNSEGCCATSIGLYDLLDQFRFKHVILETANPLEYHPRYHIVINGWHFLKIKKSIESKYHIWTKEKIFGAIYGRPLWHRLGIASHLIHHYNDRSLVGMLGDPTIEDQRNLFEVHKLWCADPTSFQAFATISDKFPIKIDQIEEYTPGKQDTDGFTSQVKMIYPKFLVEIVNEPFTTGRCFFITEKTVRPMLLKKPFILMGSKFSLRYLQQMGFRTFNEFWDEGYDSYGENNRYHQIIKLIDNIAQKPLSDLIAIYDKMQEILHHNYNLLLSQSFNLKIEYHKESYE